MTIQTTNLEPWEHQAIEELIAQMQDPQRALEDAKLEDEADCDISAGPELGRGLGRMLADPAGFYQHQRLKRIVFRGLRELLEDCDLGAGLPAAQSIGKQLLNERLQQPDIEIQQQLMAILAEDLSASQDVPLSATAQATLRQVIQTVLSSEDLDAISSAAALSLQQHVRAVVMLPQTA
ncbi:MAG: hypothetical protein ACR2FS_09145 [Phormidesmis sp.]